MQNDSTLADRPDEAHAPTKIAQMIAPTIQPPDLISRRVPSVATTGTSGSGQSARFNQSGDFFGFRIPATSTKSTNAARDKSQIVAMVAMNAPRHSRIQV